MSDAQSNALALTAWGAATIDALQSATDTGRDEIARRACEDAITDARNMASLQGSLFEKLLVIERFGLYRSQGCESIQEFIDREVAPLVQLHRKTLYKLREAVGEAGRLLDRYGTVKADWTNLYLLAAETRRQGKGAAVLPADDYDRVSQRVAEGSLSHRELSSVLQRRLVTAPKKRTHAEVARCHAAPSVAPRVSPFDELARIAAEAKRPQDRRRVVDLGPTMDLADQLLAKLSQITLMPVDTWVAGEPDLSRLQQLMTDLRDSAAAVSEVARLAEAA